MVVANCPASSHLTAQQKHELLRIRESHLKPVVSRRRWGAVRSIRLEEFLSCLNTQAVCLSIIKRCFTDFFLLQLCEAWSHKVIRATNRLALKWSSYGFVLISTRKSKNEFEMHFPAADRNLIESRANSELEVLLATGCKLQLSPYWIFWGRELVFLGWGSQTFRPSFAKLSLPCLQFRGCCGNSAWARAVRWSRPSENYLHSISNRSNSFKGKLE